MTLTLTAAAADVPRRWHLARYDLNDHRLALVVERSGSTAPVVQRHCTVL